MCQVVLWLKKSNVDELLTIFSLRKQMMLSRIDAKNSVRKSRPRNNSTSSSSGATAGGRAPVEAGHGGMMGK